VTAVLERRIDYGHLTVIYRDVTAILGCLGFHAGGCSGFGGDGCSALTATQLDYGHLTVIYRDVTAILGCLP
jgi:hypothetical protein